MLETGNLGLAIKVGSWVHQTLQIYYYSKRSERKLEVLFDRLHNVQEDAAKLYQYVKDAHPYVWSKRCAEIDATLQNLVNLDENLAVKPKRYKYSDMSDILSQYINRLEAINFLNNQVPALSEAVVYLRSNMVNFCDREIQSVSDLVSFLESTSEKLRTGSISGSDSLVKDFESSHANSFVYGVLRKNKLESAKTLKGKIKRLENRKSLQKYHSFSSAVATSLSECPPEYHPRGKYFRQKPDSELSTAKKEVLFKMYDLSFPLTITYTYEGRVIDSLNLRKAEKKARKTAKKNGTFDLLVECKVADIIGEEPKSLVRNFDSEYYVPFLFELDSEELIYNANSRSASVFQGYFNPDENPATIRHILSRVECKKRVFASDLETKLGFTDETISDLVEDKLLLRIRSIPGIYALMRGG